MSETTTAARWSDDLEKLAKTMETIQETFSGPWGPKASEEDVISDVAIALGLSSDFHTDRDNLAPLAEKLWDWKCEQPSPLVEGLASLVEDGLTTGAVVPVEEVAAASEMDEWEIRQAKVVLDLLQDHFES